MNLELFIAKRLISDKNHKDTISSPITKIAIAAIALGMVMMIVSVGTGIGLQEKIREKVAAFNGHIIISSYTGNDSDVSTVPISTNQKFYPKFKTIKQVKHIQGVATKTAVIRTDKNVEGVIFKGVGKDYDFSNLKDFLIQGKLPNTKSIETNEILISQFLANRLQLKLGQKCNAFFMKDGQKKLPTTRRFTIVGIYNSGFAEFDANYIIGDIRHLQHINKWAPNQVGSFEVFVDDFSKIDDINKLVYKEIGSNLDSQPISKKYYFIFEWLKLFDFNIIVILFVMILVSVINMVVALLVIILEKIQTIGILKSLGANNWLIRKIFLYNTMFIILKGLFIGNTIGIALLLIQKYFGLVKLNPENYYVTVAPVSINIIYIAALNIIVLLICFTLLILPSYIITKINPSKTIKFT